MPVELSIYEKQLMKEIRGMHDEYMPNLLHIVRLFRESVTLKAAADSFLQGWQETLAEQTKPVSELWDGINAE